MIFITQESYEENEVLRMRSQSLDVIGLYHPLDGATNLEYNLLCFLAPNKIIF